jgi:hypothetical protein
MRRKLARIGREEGEWRLFVLAVLRKVEVDPAHDVPGGVQPFQEGVKIVLDFAKRRLV